MTGTLIPPHEERAWRLAERRTENTTQLRVVRELHTLRRKFGVATPSVANLAEHTDRSPRSVIRATESLVAAGHLRKITAPPRKRPDGTWYRAMTNLYAVLVAPRKARNTRWHRGDIDGTSTTDLRTDRRGAPVPDGTGPPPDTPPTLFAPDPPADPAAPDRWYPGLVGKTWRDLVVRGG